ncbi:MAG TPA: hypothetical protein VEN79_06170 [Terriglobia bacterium]|nr:hypothetical protein [Terriglobia bacterium]
MSIPIPLGSSGIIGEIDLPTQRSDGDSVIGSLGIGRLLIGDW